MRYCCASAGALLLLILSACGGGGGDGSPSPTPNPPTSTNPCANVSLAGLNAPGDERLRAEKRSHIDGDSRYDVLDALALNRSRTVGSATSEPAGPSRDNIDIGEIAVVQDEGDLVAPPNSFDLRGAGVRFTRN
ncbi:MAG: hypothetical protein H0W08_13470, partial [Acidobacteria bacterium]|nr:hypothetical protein [Acidobacteriota bacterium]